VSEVNWLAAWVRYPAEYSDRTGSMFGIWVLISDSMVAGDEVDVGRSQCHRGAGEVGERAVLSRAFT
jgi:hypothetical protein